MATVSVYGFDELSSALDRLRDVPWPVMSAALDAMGSAGEAAVAAAGASMGVFDPESGYHILDAIYHTRPRQNDDGGYCVVTFKGSRTRRGIKTANSLIAFENEYGNRHQMARPFVRLAATKDGDQIAAPGETIVLDWMEKTFTEG